MAAASFHGTGHQDVADIGDAYKLLSPLLGTGLASALFAIALPAGSERDADGHAAGQIVTEGFINIRFPWLRRLITRSSRSSPRSSSRFYGERQGAPNQWSC
jgi:manganese transport protein